MAVFKKGKNWYIDYYLRGQRKRKKIGPSKQLAELALKDVELKIAKKEYLGIYEEKQIFFENFAQDYLEHCQTNHSPRSYDRDELTFRVHLIPCFKGQYLFNITVQSIEKYKGERLKKVKPATVNRELTALKTMFKKAVEWGCLKKSPATGIKKLKVATPFPRFLSQEETRALLAVCPSHIQPIVIAALNTGMRKSELLNLEWTDVDFKNKLIRVDNKEGHHTKNYEPRIVPMNNLVYAVLKKIPRHFKSGYVFCDRLGRKFGDVKKGFRAALDRAQIKNFRFHDMRHTFASHLVMSGCDIRTVQKLLGHKTIEMTMRYSHLSKDHLKNAVNNLDFCEPIDTVWTPGKNQQKVLTPNLLIKQGVGD